MTTTTLDHNLSPLDRLTYYVSIGLFQKMVERRGVSAFHAYWALAESDYDSNYEKAKELHDVTQATFDLQKKESLNAPESAYRYFYYKGFSDASLAQSQLHLSLSIAEAAGDVPVEE